VIKSEKNEGKSKKLAYNSQNLDKKMKNYTKIAKN